MKHFLLLVLATVLIGCNDNTSIKGPEHLEFSLDEAVLVSTIKHIDSADVNVQYITKTKYFFKKYDLNKILLILHIKPEVTIDQEFIEKQIKRNKLVLEREVINYFSYDGIVIEIYQGGKKVHTYEEDLNQ